MPFTFNKEDSSTVDNNIVMENNENTSERDWYFVQVKGKLQESEVIESDIITCVIFNHDGQLLATGDRGGRVVVFQKCDSEYDTQYKDEYNVYATFQSHEQDFDYLKSVDIEEKINKICWLRPCNNTNYMLTTNDKTIKLFKIADRPVLRPISTGLSRAGSFKDNDLPLNTREIPSISTNIRRQSSGRSHYVRNGRCKISYPNAHAFNIHSISACPDRDFFLSADDLRVNLWNLERNDTCFTIVDIRPESMEDLCEVITCCQFHPSESSIFLYSTSRGSIKLCDTRIRSVCDAPAATYDEMENSSVISIKFSEVVRSISDLHFASSPRYFITRNYLEVKVWDINMARGPIESYLVQDYLNTDTKLTEMYESDAIFDKFDSRLSPDSKSIISGSYGNIFNVTHRGNRGETTQQEYYEANCDFVYPPSSSRQKLYQKNIIRPSNENSKRQRKDDLTINNIKFNKKIGTLDWHPNENIIAVGAHQNLYIYSQNDYVSPS